MHISDTNINPGICPQLSHLTPHSTVTTVDGRGDQGMTLASVNEYEKFILFITDLLRNYGLVFGYSLSPSPSLSIVGDKMDMKCSITQVGPGLAPGTEGT